MKGKLVQYNFMKGKLVQCNFMKGKLVICDFFRNFLDELLHGILLNIYFCKSVSQHSKSQELKP